MKKKYQVVGIGNAMVDILAHVDDAFLEKNGVQKGIMQLIDMDRAVELYGHMGPAQEVSGGSAANTIAGIAALEGPQDQVDEMMVAFDERQAGTIDRM